MGRFRALEKGTGRAETTQDREQGSNFSSEINVLVILEKSAGPNPDCAHPQACSSAEAPMYLDETLMPSS